MKNIVFFGLMIFTLVNSFFVQASTSGQPVVIVQDQENENQNVVDTVVAGSLQRPGVSMKSFLAQRKKTQERGASLTPAERLQVVKDVCSRPDQNLD